MQKKECNSGTDTLAMVEMLWDLSIQMGNFVMVSKSINSQLVIKFMLAKGMSSNVRHGNPLHDVSIRKLFPYFCSRKPLM